MVSSIETIAIVLAVLLIAAYGTLVWVIVKLVNIVLGILKTQENRFTVMEQVQQFTWRDTSEMKRQLARFFALYGYINPAYAQQEREEAEAAKRPIEREPDL